MAKSGVVARHLHTLLKLGAVGGLSDGQLLERFVTRHGEVAEAAFAALVERHGAMVLGVCRRILADPRDAEDAFQATFLVLVKKARRVRVDDSLGRWLYGVACRVAARARTEAGRRQAREGEGVVDCAGPSFDSDRFDLRRVLDEELDRLPEKYRVPVVLCYLEGLTHELAAERLGWPVGTVRGRLSRARERLRTRLSSRGLAPTAAGLWDFPTPLPMRAVSHTLVEETVRAAIQYTTARVALGGISTAVAVLTEGALKTMVLSKVKTSVALLFAMVATTMVAPAFLVASDPPALDRGYPVAAAEKKSEPKRSKSQIEASELAAKAFGPTHWSANPALPVRYSSHKRGYWMYAQEYERLNDGKQLRLRPVAIVRKSRNGEALKTVTSDEAIVDLDQPLGVASKSGVALKIRHVRFEGNVRFNIGRETTTPGADLAIGPLANAEFDETFLTIRSDSDLTIEDRNKRITGSGLSIEHYPDDEGGGIKSIKIKKNVHVNVKESVRSKVMPGQPEGVDGQGSRASLDLRCTGMLLIEWTRPKQGVKVGPPEASKSPFLLLSGAVDVSRPRREQQPDQLNCDELRLDLRSDVSRGAGAGTSLHELRATGSAVWLRLPGQGITARCNEFIYKKLSPHRADETHLRGDGRNEVWVEMEKAGPTKGKVQSVTTIRTSDATIFEEGEGSETATTLVCGPGFLETRPSRDKPVEGKTSWQDHFIMRTGFDGPDRPTKQFTLTGRPELFGPGSTTLNADKSIVISLEPTAD
ncbi:RNA polymerase sigma factor, sigma-70 family [Singulisphaera sp. GP187]|uniref:RNA polymerase sigma factor n=1 Tax=Singulisphaera sp. GP187 TaxID=1882752 RepID=UPI0009279005|nr:sigma-70 family RNA polymerase sigma factor [Singulisphaera sp. GP187]SIO36055.1 RNA polymerase sigma factor, sigma-70 family [Singulisphaera sp. GP187]